jgi:hypothetical protein
MGNRKCKNPSHWSPFLSPTRTYRPLARVAHSHVSPTHTRRPLARIAHSHASPTRPLALSPTRPFSPSSLRPPRFALCPLLSALYNERGQGSASDTPGSHFGSRPGSGHFPIIACEPRFPRLDLLLIFFESRRSQRGSTFSFTPVLSVDPASGDQS